eukprot:293534-Chlamydomonas_euryale.AAC.1
MPDGAGRDLREEGDRRRVSGSPRDGRWQCSPWDDLQLLVGRERGHSQCGSGHVLLGEWHCVQRCPVRQLP